MDLETILFTVIEGIVLFVAVYFFFSNIKIRGETRNQYLPLIGKLLSFGVALALISDFILAYSILNPSQPPIFSYGILAILLFYTVLWAIMVVEKIRGRSFSWMENLFEPKWMDER